MANMRAIRTRIKSLKSTQQMTKSMKMVAASKLRRTQTAYGRMRPFAECCGEMLQSVVHDSDRERNPFLRVSAERNKVCYVLFVGSRGLCGTYNQALLRFAAEQIRQDRRDCSLVVCGRWGKDLILKAGLRIERWFDQLSDTPTAADSGEVSAYLKELYRSGTADEIVLLYQQYASVLVQTPERKQLLPLEISQNRIAAGREYLFEPERGNVLDVLVEQYIDHSVYAAMLEARTGEHAARMTAMTSASDNANELITKMELELNHARQAAITTEIAEISGGASVLGGGKTGL